MLGYYEPLKLLIKQGEDFYVLPRVMAHPRLGVESGFIRKDYQGIIQFVERPEGDGAFDWGDAAVRALEQWSPPRDGPLYNNWKSLSQS